MLFHAHIYFNKDQKELATSLRMEMIENFPFFRYNKFFTASHVLEVGGLVDKLIGPHTKRMFQVTATDTNLVFLLPWIVLRSKGLSVLLHPCSDNDLLDHTERAMWLGEKVSLNLDKL